MNTKRIAVYAGSFDPPTNGHLWMIQKGASLFDQLIVAIGTNPKKKSTFSIDERLEMLKSSVKNLKNVTFTHFDNQYLVDFAKELKANFILRGVRSQSDFVYEQGMCNINRDINQNITVVFLTPPRELCEISSSMVKGLIGPTNWRKNVAKYVPSPVLDHLIKKFK
jgi:pantetheine-phosphate adenylyltransferase